VLLRPAAALRRSGEATADAPRGAGADPAAARHDTALREAVLARMTVAFMALWKKGEEGKRERRKKRFDAEAKTKKLWWRRALFFFVFPFFFLLFRPLDLDLEFPPLLLLFAFFSSL